MFTSSKDKFIKTVSLLGVAFLANAMFPVQTFAAQCQAPLSGAGTGNITSVFNFPTCIINTYLVPGAIALEIILLIAGIIIYVANGDNEGKRKEGSQFMLWGLLAIFVTLSVWGLVAIIRNTLQI